MSPREPTERTEPSDTTETDYSRRRVLAAGAGLGATMVAGCSGVGAPSDADGASGTFRLLISDQPVAIDEFDELNVTFDRARIFPADEDETGTDAEGTETDADGTDTATATEGTETVTATEGTESDTDDGDEPDDDDEDDGEERGFSVVDLDGATVDLTEVVGEKAIGVFEGELEEGRYTKVELYAEDVEGIVDGEGVEVTIPSGKLQIVKPFEVVAGETLTFVFDINVVKKGGTGAYNLLPVISGSGVAGQDVAVEEVGDATADAGSDGTDADGAGDGQDGNSDGQGGNGDNASDGTGQDS